MELETLEQRREDSLQRGGDVEERVEQAVVFINGQVTLSGLRLAQAVGQYVLETFFEGDYDRFTDPSRDKPMSFRKLVEHESLEIGPTTLYNFVRISQQLELFPAELATRLPVSHHRALLPLEDPEDKRTLARRAVDQEWTRDELEAKVRRRLPKSRAGRKPLPSWAKAIQRSSKALCTAFEDGIRHEQLECLPPGKLLELRQQIDESRRCLAQLERRLRNLDRRR